MRRAIAFAAATLFVLAACAAGQRGNRAPDMGRALAVRWRWEAPRPASVGAPAADGRGVVITYGHHRLVSLDPDGHVRWEAERLGFREQPARLTPDLVVAPTDDGGLVAVDRATGALRWDTKVGEDYADTTTPVVVGGLAITCVSDGAVVAVDVSTGRVAWRRTMPGRAEGPPATDGQQVVVSWEPEQGTAAGLTALDAATGAPRWTAPLRAGGISAPAVARPRGGPAFAVVVDDDLAAKAFDVTNGRPRWAAPVGGAGSPEVQPLAFDGGTVLVADRLAGLTLLDADGKEQWRSRIEGHAAIKVGPAGPVLDGLYALPLVNGQLLLAGPGRAVRALPPAGGVESTGTAPAPDAGLYVTSARGHNNQLVAYTVGRG